MATKDTAKNSETNKKESAMQGKAEDKAKQKKVKGAAKSKKDENAAAMGKAISAPSTIEMTGISGKSIKSVIKVVKKNTLETPKNDKVEIKPAQDSAKFSQNEKVSAKEQTEMSTAAKTETVQKETLASKAVGESSKTSLETSKSKVSESSNVKTIKAEETTARPKTSASAGDEAKAADNTSVDKTASLTGSAGADASGKISTPLAAKTKEILDAKTPTVPLANTKETAGGNISRGENRGSAFVAPAKKPVTAEKPKAFEPTNRNSAAKTSEREQPSVKAPFRPQKGNHDAKVGSIQPAARPAIRPQRGNYVGTGSDVPYAQRRGYQGGYGDRPGRSGGSVGSGGRYGQSDNKRYGDKDKFSRGGRGYGGKSGGRGDNRGDSRGFDGGKWLMDKDAPPQRNFSRQQPRRKNNEDEIIQDNKNASRTAYEQKSRKDKSRRRDEREDMNFERQDMYLDTRNRKRLNAENQHQVAVLTNVSLPSTMTVKQLAEILKKTTADVIKKLIALGMMVTVNQEIDFEAAALAASEFGIDAKQIVEVTEEDILFDDSPDDPADLVTRPPVVVVMGHVDHGKTSILDYIRKTRVASGEAGGITQHIGAYTVDVNGRTITFLDTPGHEAFTTMRARGAQITDIAVLVVAADDGVMPQTIEAINHARAANTEIIVAINKIDRPNANVEKVKTELAKYNLMDAEWGGTTTIVPVSAKTGENMHELLEMIILTADMLELKANPNRQAKGTVIESKLDKGRGPVATVLVQRGTLHTGETIVVGSSMAHVRMMYNDRGEQITEAGPSIPVEIIGLDEVPEGGSIFYQVENEKVARTLAERRKEEEREAQLKKSSHMSLDSLYTKLGDDRIDLNIVVKADVQGSTEAVKQALEALSTDKIMVKVIHSGVGGINESDIRLAEVSDAIIVGFNVRPSAVTRQLAKEAEVDIRLYSVIYEMIEEVKVAMQGMLAPEMHEVINGNADVRNIFKVSGVGTIAGCYITNGKVSRHDHVRVVRDSIVIYDGKLNSLKRFKDDAKEVAAGYECGLSIERFNDIKAGDELEFYAMKEVTDTTEN